MTNNIKDIIKRVQDEKHLIRWQQFNHCQAYTGSYIGYRFIKSYNTVVGLIDDINGIVYECGKYSRTTSKQFTQICNSLLTGYKR